MTANSSCNLGDGRRTWFGELVRPRINLTRLRMAMTSPDAAPRPFQFGLRSLFLAISVFAIVLGLLKCLGPIGFFAVLFSTGPFATVIAILVKKERRLALIWFLVASVIGIAFLLMFPSLIVTH